MRKPLHIRSPRGQHKRDIEAELSKFEQKERAFRQAERDERAAELRLPIAPRRTAIKRIQVYEDS